MNYFVQLIIILKLFIFIGMEKENNIIEYIPYDFIVDEVSELIKIYLER
jgi:hypothetical protein